MLIGLISDTHIPYHAKAFPEQLKEVFRDVELILHAGDIYVASVLDDLARLAPVLAAEGDDDYGEVLADKRLKQEHVLTLEGVTIWLFHQYRTRSWVGYEKFETKAWDKPEKHPDVIVYGHTHESALENGDGVLKINPGSATFPHYKAVPGTVGLLTVNAGKATAQIIQLH